MRKQSGFIPFLFGLVLGVLCTIFLPRYVTPYLPESLLGKGTIVKGTVLAKEKKNNALLLTVNTSQGALLATFAKKGDEVNLLVNDNDEVEFTLEKYNPFIDDPRITRVVKAPVAVSPESEKTPSTPAKPTVKGMKEGRPKGSPVSPAPSVPASKSMSDVQPQNREKTPAAPGDKKTAQ